MRTVGEVARLANVSVRTLHHYDEIGLVRPSERSRAGYRLYGDVDLERLQTVRFYRELGFGLDEVRRVMDAADFDRGDALREQRRLLEAEAGRIARVIGALDDAIDAHERGVSMSDEAMFEVFGPEQRELQREAEERWGQTDAYQQGRRRTASYDKGDWEELKAESARITEDIAAVYRSGAEPGSDAAMDAVEASRRQISERFYDCPHEMHVSLGRMYVEDLRFRATYESVAPGLAEWVRDAIEANARRAPV